MSTYWEFKFYATISNLARTATLVFMVNSIHCLTSGGAFASLFIVTTSIISIHRLFKIAGFSNVARYSEGLDYTHVMYKT